MFSLPLAFLSLSVFAQGVFSAPVDGLTPKRRASDKLIVRLKDDVSTAKISTTFNSDGIKMLDVINGFIIPSSEVDIEKLRADPNVLSVDEDQIAEITTVQRDNTTWGLQRVSSLTKLTNQDPSVLSYQYTYLEPAGSGVDVYVLDTGVRVTHEQFGGRARWGATFGGYADADGNGHGTHCAATVAGATLGVANEANIIAVKVLSDTGSGSYSDVISGLDWVYNEVQGNNRPSIISMSLRGPAFDPLDDAVATLIGANIHVVVAAGNDYDDASNWSPARAPLAVTVGAVDITDTRPDFSNYGAGVDIHAPGVDVISAWAASDTATAMLSGTSMATPHVAGLIAYVISVLGNKSPVEMMNLIRNWGLNSVIANIPGGTPNIFAHNAPH